MKFKSASAFFLMAASFACGSVFADSTHDVKSSVSNEQLNAVVNALLKVAPSGTTTSNLNFNGFFKLTEDRYLTELDVTSITFKVTVKLGFIPISSNVNISLAGTFPTLDCETPNITRAEVNGTSWLIDGQIRNHIKDNAVAIFRDNFIAQTDLVNYCKFKPVQRAPFAFDLSIIP